MPQTSAYGCWPSPLSAHDVAAASLRLGDVCVDGTDIYWTEGRASENGRCAIVRWRDGTTHDVIAAPFSARTTVHEYGGGAIACRDGIVYFTDSAKGQVFRVDGNGGEPTPITPASKDQRFADFVVDSTHNRLVAVGEDHSGAVVVNRIVAISLEDGGVTTLVSGSDFYASPRLDPNARRLAWIAWNFPQMPWDGTELWCADVATDGSLDTPQRIAGGTNESVVQPHWSSGAELYCVSDTGGWWNVCRAGTEGLINVAPMAMECASPPWNFGLSTYALTADRSLALCAAGNGLWRLRKVDADSGDIHDVNVTFTDMGSHVHFAGDRLLIDGGSPAEPKGLHLVDLTTGAVETIWRSATSPLDATWISTPESITFPTPDGAFAHAFLYRPRNPNVSAPQDEPPPLFVRVHGGPTSATSTSLNLNVQYWTTRGFAVCDVNYGGSTSYGRAYRERLRGMTGCVDVDDCVAAAQYLAQRGDVDPNRMAISGGSAGGYVVLCALVFSRNIFAAGTSYYGVTDVETLARDTHKFESRYYDSLIGPYDTHASLYHNRSPIHFVSRIRTPLLILQGCDDPVVPLSQAEALVEALRASDVPHEYVTYEGEQHGFRIAANISHALETELAFYTRVMGLMPVTI